MYSKVGTYSVPALKNLTHRERVGNLKFQCRLLDFFHRHSYGVWGGKFYFQCQWINSVLKA